MALNNREVAELALDILTGEEWITRSGQGIAAIDVVHLTADQLEALEIYPTYPWQDEASPSYDDVRRAAKRVLAKLIVPSVQGTDW